MGQVDKILNKLKNIAKTQTKKNKAEKALEAIAAFAEISYEWNQYYTDTEVENLCDRIGYSLRGSIHSYEPQKGTVLYYDTFGFDIRGLSLIYLKALADLDYKIVYVTRDTKKNSQSILHKVLQDKQVAWEYLCFEEKYITQIINLDEIVLRYRPEKIFMYSHPADIAGNIVFGRKQENVIRYKINLTDHAYWLGTHSLDFCIEFRDYGCTISEFHRYINKEKLVKLPYYPYVDREIKLEKLPFSSNRRYVFSGGALYKTLGEGNKYYRIVEHILNADKDIIFLYAGNGDDSQLRILIDKYPNRVYHTSERKDFFQIIEGAVFYLNTYPVVGALMTQYSALAGRIPITLRHNTASNGFLINQEKLHIEFDTIEECEDEIDKLLLDPSYLETRQNAIRNSVISEEEFCNSLFDILSSNKSKFDIALSSPVNNEIQEEYRYRMKTSAVMNAIAKKRHISLFTRYPLLFLKRFIVFRRMEEN